MPIALQRKVLESIVRPDQAEAWVRVLTQHGYDSPKGQVLYKTGQPMGAYSS